MTTLCDLHTHTTASDRQYTPGELVNLAKDRGLRVLRGVELSAREYPNLHILGYGFQDRNTELSRLCEKLRASRDDRKYKIADFLREKGVEIDLSEVEALAGGKVPLAHPYQMGLPKNKLGALVRRLKDWGLDAVECYYPKYTLAQQVFYLSLTEKYRLHQTGGSDFHGEKVKPDVRLMPYKLNLDWMI